MRDKITNAKVTVTIIVLALAVVGAGTGYWVWHKPAQQAQTTTSSQQTTTYIAYDGQEGQSALDLLKTKAAVATQDSAYGPYVDQINDTKATDGKYWSFYVNGQMASLGAADYTTKAGDKIEWKLQ